MKPFENLVVGVADDFQNMVRKALAESKLQWLKFKAGVELFKNSFQSFQLAWHVGGNEIAEALRLQVTEVSRQKLEVFIEGGLPGRFKFKTMFWLENKTIAKFNAGETF